MKRKLNDDDLVIELNVGGTPMATTQRTLMKQPDSTLSKHYQAYGQKWLDQCDDDYRPERKPFFIDSDPKLFAHVLQGLRTDSIDGAGGFANGS